LFCYLNTTDKVISDSFISHLALLSCLSSFLGLMRFYVVWNYCILHGCVPTFYNWDAIGLSLRAVTELRLYPGLRGHDIRVPDILNVIHDFLNTFLQRSPKIFFVSSVKFFWKVALSLDTILLSLRSISMKAFWKWLYKVTLIYNKNNEVITKFRVEFTNE